LLVKFGELLSVIVFTMKINVQANSCEMNIIHAIKLSLTILSVIGSMFSPPPPEELGYVKSAKVVRLTKLVKIAQIGHIDRIDHIGHIDQIDQNGQIDQISQNSQIDQNQPKW